MNLIIGNAIALVASFLMIYAGGLKDKKKILLVQVIEISMFVASNMVLGGYSGAIMNVFSLIGNMLCYFDRLGTKERTIITVLAIPTTVYFNNHGLIGLFPLICILTYLWLMNLKNIIHFKMLIIGVMVLWVIYDFTIQSYTSVIFDVVTIISNVISVVQIKKEQKTADKEL